MVWVFQVPGAGGTSQNPQGLVSPGQGPGEHAGVCTGSQLAREDWTGGADTRSGHPCYRRYSPAPPSLSSCWLAAQALSSLKGKGEVFPAPLEAGYQWAAPGCGQGLETRATLSTVQMGSRGPAPPTPHRWVTESQWGWGRPTCPGQAHLPPSGGRGAWGVRFWPRAWTVGGGAVGAEWLSHRRGMGATPGTRQPVPVRLPGTLPAQAPLLPAPGQA